jgi:hypothetical protein
MAMKFPAGGRLGGAEGYQIVVQVNTGDLVRLNAKIQNAKTRITPGLWERARKMAAYVVKELDMSAPVGTGGGWIRGSPTLRGSHRGTVIDAYHAVVYTEASHARPIIYGFTPHMPPEHAWVGQQELSFVMRRAVLRNETPEAPRDYWTPVVYEAERVNIEQAAILEAEVAAGFRTG